MKIRGIYWLLPWEWLEPMHYWSGMGFLHIYISLYQSSIRTFYNTVAQELNGNDISVQQSDMSDANTIMSEEIKTLPHKISEENSLCIASNTTSVKQKICMLEKLDVLPDKMSSQ